MKDNVEMKLNDLKISDQNKFRIVNLIFGSRIGKKIINTAVHASQFFNLDDKKIKGLVDSSSEESYDKNLSKFIEYVSNLGENEREFCNYFLTYKSRLIKETMRSDIRTTVNYFNFIQ